MTQIILGTAGHIDHGKTSLIKAITGINTDRLKEEQARGITIELGFAALGLPSGQQIGIVDVPGHEKFVKNMVAGATGIDIVALVVAADEGIMPQTREHMEICSLLDIQYGIVALTKVDLVDEEWLELVKEELADFTRNTFLEGAAVVPVSSATGLGLDAFTSALDDLCTQVVPRSDSGLFRLPVDRVFTMKGFGTVITGTLVSGKVSVGDQIMIYPSLISSKVRGVQAYGDSVTTAHAGMRTAINFQGLDKTAVNRGDIVAGPETLEPSHMVDVTLNYLPGNKKRLKNRTRVRFHSGTSEIMGIVVLLDGDTLEPGTASFAQIRLEAPVTLVKDDRYVLRSYSPVRTIGGGRIIQPIAPKHKPNRPKVLDYLKDIAGDDASVLLQRHIEAGGHAGCTRKQLKLMANLPDKQLEQLLQNMLSQRAIYLTDKENQTFLHASVFESIRTHTIDSITAYHLRHPLKPGIPKEELKSILPHGVSAKTFLLLLQQMSKAEEIVVEEDIVRLASHSVSLAADEETLRKQILDAYEQGGLTPPYFKEVCKTLNVKPDYAKQVLNLLIQEAQIIKVKEDLYFHQRHLEKLKQELTQYLMANEEITTPQFKDMTGASRKYVIPLIEHFDTIQLTIRIGDIRKLRKRPGS